MDMNISKSAQKKITLPTLSEKAYIELYRMIQERELPSGEPIIEAYLAELLGVSRTPLRQALQRLESEGLLRKLESRSYVLRCVELKEYLQSLKVREILEAEAAGLAIGRIDLSEIDQVRKNIHEVQTRVPYDKLAHWHSDDQVHDIFIRTCGNQVIRDILHSLRVTTKLFEIEQLSERLKPDNSQHEAILDALSSGDVTAARDAVKLHLRALSNFAIREI